MKTSLPRSLPLCLSLGIFAICAVPSAQAVVLSYESFSGYTVPAELQSAGNPTVAGYSGNWTDIDFGTQEPATQAGSLDYAGAGYAAEIGDKVGVPNSGGGETAEATSGRVFRMFDSSLVVNSSTTGTLYLSFLFQSGQQTGATTYQMLSLFDGSTTDAARNFDLGLTTNGGQSGTNYNFGVDNIYSSTGVAADTSVHLLVAKFTLGATLGADSVTVWVDPTIGEGDPTGGTPVSGLDLTWDRLALSDYDGNSAAWDEIRWGTTFADVVPEPGAPLLLLGSMGMLVFFRRRGTPKTVVA